MQDLQTKKEFPKFEVADIGAEQTLPTDMIIEQKGKEKENENDLLIIVIFFDDIIFGGNDEASDKFSKEMKNEFEMSMIGEMKRAPG